METMTKVMQTVFGGVWDLFNSVTVPGFGISLARVLVGFFVIKWSLNLLALVTGFRSNAANASASYRAASESARHYKAIYDKKVSKSK